MNTALAGLNLGAANAAPRATQTHPGDAPAKTDDATPQDKPRFDRLMEKKQAQAKPAQSAGKRSDKPLNDSEQPPAEEPGKPERAFRKPKTTEAWPSVGLVPWLQESTVPALPPVPVADAQASVPIDPALDGTTLDGRLSAAQALVPASDGAIALGSPALSTIDGSTGALADPALLDADSLAIEIPLPNDTPAIQPAQAESHHPAKPALQNLLSFAGHLASGNIAAAAPEAIALVKDVVEVLRTEGEAEAVAPTTNAMAAPNAASPHGLARTATVNPLEAPMPELHNERFDEAVGTRLTWMAEQKIGHAHIKISPNDLGTVEVRLRLDGDRVHADFSSAQPEVRQALENSLPKLRDMLGQHGFQLAQADVGHRQDSRPSPDAPVAGHGGNGETAPIPENDALLPRSVRVTAHGLLDAYA